MSHEYETEYDEPAMSRCDCCGGLTVRLTRFGCRDGDAFAVYFVSYSNIHPDDELAMIISLGEWGEESDPSERVAFHCRVRATEESCELELGDAAQSLWGDAANVGQLLSREEALAHPW